jgi:hypothetical protein
MDAYDTGKGLPEQIDRDGNTGFMQKIIAYPDTYPATHPAITPYVYYRIRIRKGMSSFSAFWSHRSSVKLLISANGNEPTPGSLAQRDPGAETAVPLLTIFTEAR